MIRPGVSFGEDPPTTIGATMFLVWQIGRAWGVIMVTLGVLGILASVVTPDQASGASLVLSIVLLLAGPTLFFFANTKANEDD
jgi:hypothetical protein